ncbi:ABC transporter substrate-binding protein [Frondihabitans sucicola]|uniref:ABC transporter substrate-binding protein n=1 Tax=Frondihabitans sucicola TaxID=1268041 RepID=A0ABM8GS98_9MICO|nr:ABC transporter substrate-binding protein [Frondihabitans sucicola]BDZ51300.1 ABC transporter substrate-binding protein [Frondihabitans sucicola]
MRIRTRAAIGLAAAATVALALTGCSSGGSSDTAGSSGSVTNGGNLTFAIANDPISLNPSGTGSGNDTLYVTRQLVDSLLYQDPKTGDLKPWLASSYTVNSDATKFTFTLRSGVTFSDGTKFDASAVKATFDDIVAAGAKSTAVSSLVGYTGSTVVDPSTVEVDFSKPNAAFPQATSSVGLGIVSVGTTKIPYDDRSTGKGVVGTGPFTLKSYSPNVKTVLTKRKDYDWGPADRSNTGAAHLASVTFQVVPEASVRSGSLSSGQVDVIGSVQPTDVDTLKGGGYPLVTRTNPGLAFGFSFNEARPIVKDEKVREAIAHALDSKTIRDTSLNSLFPVGTSALASTTPGYKNESSFFEYDLASAKKLLTDDGWKVGADGIRVKDGTKLSLKVAWITNFSPNQTTLELAQQELKKAGIAITLQSSTVPDFLKTLTSGNYDLQFGNNSRADGDILRTSFSTAATNYSHLDDPTLEALLQKQQATPDVKEREAVIGDIQTRLASQYHEIPVHELTTILATAKGVTGVTLGADSRLDQLTGASTTAK